MSVPNLVEDTKLNQNWNMSQWATDNPHSKQNRSENEQQNKKLPTEKFDWNEVVRKKHCFILVLIFIWFVDKLLYSFEWFAFNGNICDVWFADGAVAFVSLVSSVCWCVWYVYELGLELQ